MTAKQQARMSATEEQMAFDAALKANKPAREIFTSEALMLIFLALGVRALK